MQPGEVGNLGIEDRYIRLTQKKLTPLPPCCPKCGEEKRWTQVRIINPYESNPTREDNILEGLFSEAGPVGALIGALIPVRRKVTYRCASCGFRGEYYLSKKTRNLSRDSASE